MPWSAPTHCPVPGHAAYQGERCPLCTATRKAAHEVVRPTSHQRGYDSRWRKASRTFLAEHTACATCGGRATAVDHVIPHRGNQALFWAKTNWQPLCSSCHSRKTARVDGGFGHHQARGEGRNPCVSAGNRPGNFPRNSGQIQIPRNGKSVR